MLSTRISRHVKTPRASVYRAILNAHAAAKWMVPSRMTSRVHAFDPREGGSSRISLTYDTPTGPGKTPAHTDPHHGRFVKLVVNEQVVQVVEFERNDPALRGEMTLTYSLTNAVCGADILRCARGAAARGVPSTDNEAAWRRLDGRTQASRGLPR